MDLTEFAPLSPAEEKLIADCSSGERISFGGGEYPVDETPDVQVRGALLREILVAPEKAGLHPKGLRLRGAWISGALDMQGSDCAHDLSLTQCHIAGSIELVNARMRGLHVSGSWMTGLSADNARLDGALYLRRGTRVEGEISLAGVRISGDLQICDCVIESQAQDAIFAAQMQVEGSVFLGNYPYAGEATSLICEGAMFFASTRIDGDFFVTNCAVSPLQDAPATPVFMGTEEHGADIALSLARAKVAGILYLADNQIERGVVNLAGAAVGRFRDEPSGPGANYPVRLDGFEYADFSRHAVTALEPRLDWLERRPADTPFTAHPYEHLADVLRRMGHGGDARRVLMRKEKLMRAENRRLALEGGRWLRWLMLCLSDSVMRLSVGYGYRPGRVLLLALVLVAALGWFFDRTWKAGDMAPNAAPILVSADWVAATQSHPDGPAAFWSSPGQAGQDWETFHPLAYAADLVIPIVSLGQETAWAPSTSRSDWGRAGWWIRWFAMAMGWVITALGAAAVTSAVRQD